MKHIQTFENFLNEAAAIKVDLTPDFFKDSPTGGVYKNTRDTGASTWRWNSSELVRASLAGEDPNVQNVVFVEVSVFAKSSEGIAKVGITNSVNNNPATTFGKNFVFAVADAEKNLDKVADDAAKAMMDNDHFRMISQKLNPTGQKLNVKPKGDFGPIFAEVIEAAIKDKR